MRVVIVCALLVAVLAGCGGDEPGAVPDGFEQFDGSTFTFAYPAGWPPLEAGAVQGAQGPKGTGGLAPQAAVSSGRARTRASSWS